MWYIYTMEYSLGIKRNKIESFVVTWVNLEPDIQHEVSQKEKNKYYILTHLWTLDRWYWWTYLHGRNRDADTENGLVEGVRRRRGANWESNTDVYALACVRQRANRKLLSSTESQLGALWWSKGSNGRGQWEAISRGRGYIYTRLWLICTVLWQKCYGRKASMTLEEKLWPT